MKRSGLLFIFLVVQAYACKIPVATTSVYYLPDAKDICGSYAKWKKCPKFKSEVAMQGSGRISATQVYRHSGKVSDIGSCPTTTGASGQCQIPYISIAADSSHFNMGDIVSMPGLKGKKMTRKNGTTFVHPGYLIVHDVGGAIDGKGRFDLFADVGLMDKKNAFGYKAEEDLKLYHKETCSKLKTYARITPTNPKYKAALQEIRKVTPPDIRGDVEESRPEPDDKGDVRS